LEPRRHHRGIIKEHSTALSNLSSFFHNSQVFHFKLRLQQKQSMVIAKYAAMLVDSNSGGSAAHAAAYLLTQMYAHKLRLSDDRESW